MFSRASRHASTHTGTGFESGIKMYETGSR